MRRQKHSVTAMCLHLYKDRFGRPGKGNDKGKVEGMAGYTRRNFMVPKPRFASFDALNAHLSDQCRKRMGDKLRSHKNTIEERFAADVAQLQPLPAVAYDACDKQSVRVEVACHRHLSESFIRHSEGMIKIVNKYKDKEGMYA